MRYRRGQETGPDIERRNDDALEMHTCILLTCNFTEIEEG